MTQQSPNEKPRQQAQTNHGNITQIGGDSTNITQTRSNNKTTIWFSLILAIALGAVFLAVRVMKDGSIEIKLQGDRQEIPSENP